MVCRAVGRTVAAFVIAGMPGGLAAAGLLVVLDDVFGTILAGFLCAADSFARLFLRFEDTSVAPRLPLGLCDFGSLLLFECDVYVGNVSLNCVADDGHIASLRQVPSGGTAPLVQPFERHRRRFAAPAAPLQTKPEGSSSAV